MNILINTKVAALFVTLLSAANVTYATTVLANNPAPGDAFTNPTGVNVGQAVGSSGWYYNNVRKGATVGVSTINPRSGNGSVSFSSPSNGKADIEYLPGAISIAGNYVSTASLGTFSLLNLMAYDWYRNGTSLAVASQQPSLRVLLDADGDLSTTSDRGGLVFERVYNSLSTPLDQWQTDTISASTNLWNFGLGLGFAYDVNANGYAYDSTLLDWQNFLPRAKIIGFSSGVGSGWNSFSGAVDNISWTIAGVSTLSNFEVESAATVPEPATFALLGMGLLGIGVIRRKLAVRQ